MENTINWFQNPQSLYVPQVNNLIIKNAKQVEEMKQEAVRIVIVSQSYRYQE